MLLSRKSSGLGMGIGLGSRKHPLQRAPSVDSPHRTQRAIFVTNDVPINTTFTLRLVRHKRTERELEFRHVTGQLKLARFAERFGQGGMEDKGLDHVFDDRNGPASVVVESD